MASVSFRKHLFAWLLHKGDLYNARLYDSFKRDLFKDINAGTIVEIGPGTGINLNYMPYGTRWTGIEPNLVFHPIIEAKAKEHDIQIAFVGSDAEHILLPDNYADAVICTLVLCSVKHPDAALKEMRRILKPKGKLYFIEHVVSRNKWLRRMQNFCNPVNRLLADGCNCNRSTGYYLSHAGFQGVVIMEEEVKAALKLHSPHIMGYAVK